MKKKIAILFIILLLVVVGYYFVHNSQNFDYLGENSTSDEDLINQTATVAGKLITNKNSSNSIATNISKTFNVVVNGQTRTYNLYVPKSYNSSIAVPLIFVFHGGGSNNKNIEEMSNMDVEAETRNFIVVYPLGTPSVKSTEKEIQATWNGGPAGGGLAYQKKVDDVLFVKEMIKNISSQYKIDTNRIYSTGISMGGMVSYRLACEMTDTFAAIAPVASVLVLNKSDCHPTRAIPIIHFHGTADKFVPYLGGYSDKSLPKSFVVGGPYISVLDTINFFKTNNKITSSAKGIYLQGDVNCVEYAGGKNPIELCTITDGGHTWPGSKVNGLILNYILGTTTQNISATKTMLDFFWQHPLTK